MVFSCGHLNNKIQQLCPLFLIERHSTYKLELEMEMVLGINYSISSTEHLLIFNFLKSFPNNRNNA
jgi:hypothetical protein